MPTLLIFLVVFFFGTGLRAQELPIGAWRSHLPYQDVRCVVGGERVVYVSTPFSLYRYDRTFRVPLVLDKTKGLSDAGINLVAYHPRYKQAVIAYSNGNLDIFDEETEAVANAPAILNNRSIMGEKRINDLFCDSLYTYVCTNFGLVSLDMEARVFRSTTFTPNHEVLGLGRLGDSLFMGTNRGLFVVANNGSVNLLDFANWRLHGAAEGLPSGVYRVGGLGAFGGQLLALINDTLMVYGAGNWEKMPYFDRDLQEQRPYWVSERPVTKMRINQGFVHFFSNGQDFYTLDSLGGLSRRVLFGLSIRDAWIDERNIPYVGTDSGMTVMATEGWFEVRPAGPPVVEVSSMTTDSLGQLWLTCDPVNYSTAFFARRGIAWYQPKENKWTQFNLNSGIDVLGEAFDFIVNTPQARGQGQVFGSFLDGLFIRKAGGDWSQYDLNTTGVSLGGAVGDATRTRVTGLAYDNAGQLWISNHLALRPLSVLKRDETWQAFPLAGSTELGPIAIDRNGFKWIANTRAGLTVFDEGLMEVEGDERQFTYNVNNSELGAGRVRSLIADRRGIIWVGTDNGLTIFACGNNLFDGACLGNRPVINPDNFNGRLLENLQVRALAVDGANRKWAGTNEGLFLLSDDGLQTLAFFNTENSPLPDNNILALAIDPVEGYVYVATEKGLMAYRAEATAGRRFVNKEEVLVFPNPVPKNHEGLIAIRGLATDVSVKITDVSGLLVFETRSLGGQAVWDGRDYRGNRVRSGVYLIWTVDTQSGGQSLATKVIVLGA